MNVSVIMHFLSVVKKPQTISRISLVSVIYMHFSYLQIKSDLPFFLLRWDFKKALKTCHTRVLYKGTQLKRVKKKKKKLKKEITLKKVLLNQTPPSINNKPPTQDT